MNIHAPHDIDLYFDYVYDLVRKAGQILLEAVNVQVDYKDENLWDQVTQYDLRIEDVLIKQLKNKFPNHKFIGEEESSENGKIATLTDDPTWIIDPIDGTSNFIRQFPITCISVGLTINKIQTIGIIYNPYLEEMYTAIKGRGAFLNGMRIATSNQSEMNRSIFNYELTLAKNEDLTDLYMKRLPPLMEAISGLRSLGCAALGLCYVARGTTDAYQCDGLQPWDAAAGVLIVREAGGYVCDSSRKRLGEEFDLMKPNFLATASKELGQRFVAVERAADNS